MAMADADNDFSVMVVGAGSAGLLIAQGLKKAGIPCIVFEQDVSLDARPRDWDFGIYWAQSPLGQCLPDELNDAIASAQVDNHVPSADDGMPMFNGATGEMLKFMSAPFHLRLGRKRFVKLIGTGIDIRYGKRLAKVTPSGDAVTATFADGTEHTASLLIGAEGAHSPVREFLLGPEKAKLLYCPIVATVTLSKLPADKALELRKQHHRACMTWHPNGTFLWLGIHDVVDKPDPADWIFIFIMTWRQDEPPTLTDNKDIIRDFKRRVDVWAEPFRGVAQSIPDDQKAWHSRLAYWPTQPWENVDCRGKVTLAGDSAHPMTFHRGQGLNNAVTDAASFVQQVQAMPSRTREALATAVMKYEEELWVRGNEAVLSSLENSIAIHDWDTLMSSPIMRIGVEQKDQGGREKGEREQRADSADLNQPAEVGT